MSDFNKDFCAINAFKRIDRTGKGWINSLDLVEFFHSSSKVIPETDTYMLINAFDSDADGKLSLFDLTKLLCPITYQAKSNIQSTKKNFTYALANSRV